MKSLGHDDKPLEPEDFPGPNHRVQCSKPRIITIDPLYRNARVNQCLLHRRGFVVTLPMIVTAHDQHPHAARMKKLRSCGNPTGEKQIRPVSGQLWRASKHQRGIGFRHLPNLGETMIFG